MQSHDSQKLWRLDLGRTRFKETWDLQKKMVSLRKQEQIPDCLLLTEHEAVITMGRGTSPRNLLVSKAELKRRGIELHTIERGGDITYHGPGQTVLYPIIDLTPRGRDLHKYLRDLEQVILMTLEELGMKPGLKPGLTGVWVGDCKVAAIGVAVSHWITYHGAALNVAADLQNFSLINPCGITAYPVGSLSQLLSCPISSAAVNDLLAKNFAAVFKCEMEISILPDTLKSPSIP